MFNFSDAFDITTLPIQSDVPMQAIWRTEFTLKPNPNSAHVIVDHDAHDHEEKEEVNEED